MKKQDMNGVRTPLDVERRHKLGAIPGLEKDVSDLQEEVIVDSQLSSSSTHAVQNKVITQNFTSLSNNKVDKVTGKGLSSNDFTDSEKASIHTHTNKTILDGITQSKIDQWDANSNTDVYSTSETLTNKVWIGNKPVYRKVCIGSFNDEDTLVSNVEELISCSGSGDVGTGIIRNIPWTEVYNDNNFFLTVDIVNNNIRARAVLNGSASQTSANTKFILEYTKTTNV